MSTSLKAKIWQQASADAGLQALLGTSPFRLYDTQLPQGALKLGSCVEMLQVSNPLTYEARGRMATSFSRMQFTVFGAGNDSENAEAVVQALKSFFDGFNGCGLANLPIYPNQIVGDRDAGIAQTDPLTYQRVLDVMIFEDETV